MLKKYWLIMAAVLILAGCRTVNPADPLRPEKLGSKDIKNAEKMSQLLGIKHERVLVLAPEELDFALQYPEYFADSAKMLGFSAVAVPFSSSDAADISTKRGKSLLDFVMYLNYKSLRTVYLLRESFFVNRQSGTRFILTDENPYVDILLKLKEFWRAIPESAEMPTVVIALEMNRWDVEDENRPRGMLFLWNRNKDKKGDSNDRMFLRSMGFFEACRKILALEQLILLEDEEVAVAGKKGALTMGSIAELLQKCDALGIDFVSETDEKVILERVKLLGGAKERGTVFVLVSPENKSIDSYQKWLSSLDKWQKNAVKFPGFAGIWIQDWNKLNMIWRQAK